MCQSSYFSWCHRIFICMLPIYFSRIICVWTTDICLPYLYWYKRLMGIISRLDHQCLIISLGLGWCSSNIQLSLAFKAKFCIHHALIQILHMLSLAYHFFPLMQKFLRILRHVLSAFYDDVSYTHIWNKASNDLCITGFRTLFIFPLTNTVVTKVQSCLHEVKICFLSRIHAPPPNPKDR